MAADVGAPREARGKKTGVRRPKRRLGIRIDMTPMVDIAFLLLIFYMVTTVFSMPQAMEVNLPPASEEQIKIKESKVLSIHVDAKNRFYWNVGRDLPVPMRPDSLRTLLIDKNKTIDSLNTLIIIHKDARYRTMVDILDEVDLVERCFNAMTAYGIKQGVDGRWYVLVNRYFQYYNAVISYLAAQAGGGGATDGDWSIAKDMWQALRDLSAFDNKLNAAFRERKFSYRYAMAPWEDRDGRMIEEVLSLQGGE